MVVDISDNPTPQNIQAVVQYLELFQKPGYEYALDEDDWGEAIFSDEVSEFLSTLNTNKMIIKFDWPDWHDQAVKYEQEEDALNTASMDDVRKLLTYHVRKDRFSGGHLLSVFTSGHISSILLRLSQLEGD